MGAIGTPSMNYGQLWLWKECRKLQYRYQFSTIEFSKKVSEEFERLRIEVAEDMSHHAEDWIEPEFVRFQQLGFPTYSNLLRDHPELLSAILLWDDLTFLNRLHDFDRSADFSPFYSINSMDYCKIGIDTCEIGGIAFETKNLR